MHACIHLLNYINIYNKMFSIQIQSMWSIAENYLQSSIKVPISFVYPNYVDFAIYSNIYS